VVATSASRAHIDSALARQKAGSSEVAPGDDSDHRAFVVEHRQASDATVDRQPSCVRGGTRSVDVHDGRLAERSDQLLFMKLT
jgi:hypothetical protein